MNNLDLNVKIGTHELENIYVGSLRFVILMGTKLNMKR